MPVRLISIFVLIMLIASACNLNMRAPTPTPELNVDAPPADTATPQFQGEVPVDLPDKRTDQGGDVDSSPNAAKKQVTGGDVFVNGLYERPFNANTMDKYFPYLDIVDTQSFKNDAWGYATITLSNTDSDAHLPGQYAVELDINKDGRGDWLIRASKVTSTDWSTQGVQAWEDANHDVGGSAIMAADNKPSGGDGYENLVFDEGKGSLTDGAWVRIKPDDPKTVEIAFKLSMVGNPASYAQGAWAGTNVDPAMFDYNDHMTHAQAGSPMPGDLIYPLKDMAEIDNSCRLAVGFTGTSKVPGLCSTISRGPKQDLGPPPPPPANPYQPPG
jgi:hypothetical protein